MCDIEDLGVNYHSMQKINDDNWNAIVSELDNKRGDIKNDNDLVTFRLYIQKNIRLFYPIVI
jgi:hypothetical protein